MLTSKMPANDVADFMHAVRAGDLVLVRQLAAADPALVRSTDPQCFGSTALIHAANGDNREMVDLLLSLGADINQRSNWWAGSFGVLDGTTDEMANYLISRGAKVTVHAAARLGLIEPLRDMLDLDSTLVHARGGDGQTPLHFARTVEIADLLLARGAHIDALDIDHASTPAQWLSERCPEVAAHLAAGGAATDPFLAARIGDTSLLQALIQREKEGVNVRVSRERFSAPPPAAGHIYLYSIGEGCTLAHAAAAVNQPAVVRYLVANGANVNARGGYDDATPLHVAAWNDKPAVAEALIDTGADLNAPSGHIHRNEPIGWAIVGGSYDTFRVLLKRGATIRPHHLEGARNGAKGAFREYNPRRPLTAWQQIAAALVMHQASA